MSIRHVNITNERTHYCVHLQDEGNNLFFLVSMQADASSNWARLQEWLDAGNQIVDDMSNQETYYRDARRREYPPIVDQLDTLYHGGYDAWKAQVQAIKNKYPKP
jgi:hypothetical protein